MGHTVKTSKKDNVHKQEKERHEKVEIRKIEQQQQKQIKEKNNQSCAVCHDNYFSSRKHFPIH